MDGVEEDIEGKEHLVTSDSVPSSSTDADLKQTNTGSINEDAISSTSADPESCKVLYPDVNQFAAGLSAQDINLIIMGQPASSDEKKGSPSTADSDFLELNMSGTITENITEDVEDIVQDLENLLGESTDSFSVVKNRKTMENVGKEEESRSSSNDAVDPFTMFENQLAERERQILKERNDALCSPEIDSPKEIIEIIESTKPDETSESVEIQDVSDVQSIQSSQIVEETAVETAAEPQKEELTVSGSTFETNIETPQTNTELQINLVETKNVELEHSQDENIDRVEKNEEKISVQLEPGHNSVVSPKCDPVIETSLVLQHEPSIIQDSENAESEEVLTLVSNIDTANLNEGDTVASFSSIIEEQNVEAVDDKEETDQQGVYCSSSQITNESKDSSEITDSQELEEDRSRFKEDVNVDIKQCDSEEIENEDTTIEAERADQLDIQFTSQTETTTEESINEIDSNTNLVSSQFDAVDSNLESSKMDVDELDEMESLKENTEKSQYESTSYDVTPMEVDEPFDYGTNDDNKTHEEIEASAFEDAPAVCSLETIHGNIDDNEMENILYSNVISKAPKDTESTDKIDETQNKDETDLAVESLGMILQDETVGNEYEENEEVNAVIEEDNTATEKTPFQATSPLVQENVDADLNARGVTENASALSENDVIEESSQIQEEINRDFINDECNTLETLEEGVGDDDDNEMQMSSTTPEESCSNAQVVNTELEENKISDIDESVHEAEQISEINSASNNTQEIDELCDSIEAAKVKKESLPVAGTSHEEPNEEEPPTDEIEKSQNKLTLEAVESLVNYEFEENFISSSDGGKSYSNATQESLPYEIQENVPVSSSGSNYIESSSSSFCENTEDIPKEIIEEANVEDVSRADSAEKSDDQSNDDVESSTEKEEPEQKISIKIKTNQTDHSDVKTPLLISIEGENASETSLLNEENVQKGAAEREESRGPLKMTITKQADSTHSILKIFNPSENESEESIEAESKPCEQSVPKLIIKPVQKPDSDQPTIPKITIKPIQPPPECSTGHLKMPESNVDVNNPLKMTIRSPAKPEQNVSPKLTIKPLTKPESHETGHHSPRITIKPIVKSPEDIEQVHSPRLTIKPIVKPIDESKMMELEKFGTKLTIKPLVKPREEPEVEVSHGPRLTIKPVVKPHDETKSNVEQVHSPRLTIKPIVKPSDEAQKTEQHSPRITIKPVVKPDANEPVHSPKITIKPILRPEEIEVTPTPKITIKPIMRSESEQSAQSPRITIKPPVKPPNPVEIIEIQDDDTENNKKVEPSPKITIKPVGKPPNKNEIETIDLVDYEDEIKQERIVLKINKNTIPGGSRENTKKQEDAGNEKLGKLRLKFSREGRRAHIVTPRNVLLKRSLPSDAEHGTQKRLKTEQSSSSRQSGKEQLHTKLKQILSSSFVGHISGEKMPGEFQVTKDKPATTIGGMEISVVDKPYTEEKDPLADIPVFEISPETIATVVKPPVVDLTSDNASESSMETSVPVAPPPPRKRGRPRKVPLVVREEFKDPKEETPPEPPPPQEHYDSGRPKRSCRGPSVRMTLGIKPRKPRGPGRGRGGKRGMGTRPAPMKPVKEPKLSAAKLKLLKALKEPEKEIEEKDVIEEKVEPDDTPEVVIYEEETRMSADSSSRAQTPAKQVISSSVEIEESQSSFQSSATTESVKVRKGPRLEVHQEPEGAVISAEQLAEYSWGGGGPYMLQEQVAQFLGIKSFKRKYPGIKRRPLEMQERDFIRESGLASEAMCDLGLTAVNSADILDIMYSDFQHKYEEYCKHQRDRQAKDLTNKQKALSLAAKQENNKIDITEQAIQSAASWNSTFNKARREERKAFVDLQTFTIQYPKGKMKQINKEKVGNYPVALVPGQFTDWYKTFTPTELNNLPLNTMCYDAININNNIVPQDMDDSQSDCSMSDSDSSSSDSDSSDSGSSEDCNMCSPAPVLKHATAV